MATTADVISQSSSINLIAKSISTTRSSLSSTNVTVGRIQKIIETKTKVRSDLFFKNQIIERRRRESSKRREYEDQIEASKVTTNIQSGLRVASSSNQGPLSRILSFLGYLGAGWIIENLPTWVAMGREFIARMKKAGELIYSIPQTMFRVLQGFGNVLKAVGTNIRNLDFTDSSGEVRDSFTQLTDTIDLLGTQIVDGFKLMLQPTGEVDIPSTGEQQPDTNFPEVPAPSPSGGAPPDGGTAGYSKATKIPEKVKSDTKFIEGITNLAKKYNIPEDYLYTLMSFETAGSFSPSQKNLKGSGATGLIQFMPETAKGLGTSTSELSKMSRSEQLKYVDKYFSGKGIEGGSLSDTYMAVLFPAAVGKPEDFVLFGKGAMKGFTGKAYEQNKGLDLNKDGSVTKAEASNAVKKGLPKQSQASQQSSGGNISSSPTVTPQTPLSTNFAQVTGTSGEEMGNKPLSVPYSPFKPGSGAQITSGKGLRWGRQHTGYDLAASAGTSLYAYFPGKVTHIGLDGTASSAGYGNWVAWKDDVYGAYHFFGHMKDRPPVRVGQSVNQGTLMGTVGSTGLSTGPHLHWEISNNPPRSNGQFTSYEDPGSWLRSHPLKKSTVSPQLAKVPSETSLTPPSAEPEQPQISSTTPQQQRQVAESVSQERMGQQILFIDDRSVSQPSPATVSQKSYSGGSSGQITEFNMLNSFMKQKLLLDFNYL